MIRHSCACSPCTQVLEPLQLACSMDVPRIAEPALGCLHKLVGGPHVQGNHLYDPHDTGHACPLQRVDLIDIFHARRWRMPTSKRSRAPPGAWTTAV
jgi:hypothetical protein